jgi:hypothetical protein
MLLWCPLVRVCLYAESKPSSWCNPLLPLLTASSLGMRTPFDPCACDYVWFVVSCWMPRVIEVYFSPRPNILISFIPLRFNFYTIMPPLWLHSYFHPKGPSKMMKLPLLFWSQSYKPLKEIVIYYAAWFSSSESLFSSRVISSDSLARVNLFDEKTFGKQFVKSFLRGWRVGNWFGSGGGRASFFAPTL